MHIRGADRRSRHELKNRTRASTDSVVKSLYVVVSKPGVVFRHWATRSRFLMISSWTKCREKERLDVRSVVQEGNALHSSAASSRAMVSSSGGKVSGMRTRLSNSAAKSSRDTLGLDGLGSVRSRIVDQKNGSPEQQASTKAL